MCAVPQPNTPVAILEKLAEDEEEDVRAGNQVLSGERIRNSISCCLKTTSIESKPLPFYNWTLIERGKCPQFQSALSRYCEIHSRGQGAKWSAPPNKISKNAITIKAKNLKNQYLNGIKILAQKKVNGPKFGLMTAPKSPCLNMPTETRQGKR